MRRPIENGDIKNWDDMEKFWHHTYKELGVQSEEFPVLLTEAPTNPAAIREKMTETMFEAFRVPALYVANKAVLALFASGRTTGLVLDSGYDTTFSVPIYEGHALPYCVQHLGVGGRHVTLRLLQLLSQRGHTLPINIANDVKEKLCHVALDVQNEVSFSSGSRGYKLPDGKVIFIEGKERLQCPEILFKSSLVGEKDLSGFSEAILESVDTRCDAMLELRRDMYRNIVLSGGNTMFPGLKDRLDHELNSKLIHLPPAVIAPPERKLTTWIGGSILGSLPTFQQMWISKEEYSEVGPTIVSRKCF